MKKTYIKPDMKVVNLKTTGMLMTSGGVYDRGDRKGGMFWDEDADEGEGL